MSAQYTERMLEKLVKASKAMTPVQQEWLLGQLPSMKISKKEAIFDVLVREQQKIYELNQRKLGLNKVYTSKHEMVLNSYAEGLERRNEASLLHEIEGGMESLFEAIA